MKNIDYVSNGVAVLFTALQTDRLLQIISLVLTIISVLTSLFFTIFKWVKEAKQDGQIDVNEIIELHDKVNEHIDALNDIVENAQGKEDNKND